MFSQFNQEKIGYFTKKCSRLTDVEIKNSSYLFSNNYGNKNWKFGFELKEGYEWLAFTFRSQTPKSISRKDLDKLFEHSEKCLVDAYSRMKMPEQNWTKHTAGEIDFIEKYIPYKKL